MQAFFAVAGTGHASKLLFFDLKAFVYGGIDAACDGREYARRRKW